jgi:ABC-type sugar transport system substrate-binding protein/tetratricopeptide (TPR) repeat protein
MSEMIPFIGRVQELSTIDQAIKDWGSQRVICIAGKGGIGKTRLLQEVSTTYKSFHLHNERELPERKTIAVLREITTAEWSQQFIAGVHDMAQQLGIDIIEHDAELDTTTLIHNLHTAIDEVPDAIIINMGSYPQLQNGLDRALQEQIPVILVENHLQRQTSKLTARVLQDNHGGTLRSIEKLAGHIGFRGKIAVVWSDAFEPMELRKSVLESFVTRYPDIELIDLSIPYVAQSNLRVNTDTATRTLIEQHPDIQAIWSTWDTFAHGVVDALIALERTDISVYTFDLGTEDMTLIQDSANPAITTVASNAEEIGRIAIRVATLAAGGQKIDAQYLVPMSLIDHNNLENITKSPEWQQSEFGWTPWLRSRWSMYQETPYTPVRVVPIIDFDDRQFHRVNNIGGYIAEALGSDNFLTYLQELHKYREFEVQGTDISLERLRRQQLLLTERFTEEFNTLSHKQRIVLLFDTTDALTRGDITVSALDWPITQYLLEILKHLEETLVIIAGRNAEKLGKQLAAHLQRRIDIIELPGLSPEDSEIYLSEKQKATRIDLESELRDKLLYLADGRPILLDLAVEWRSRGIPMAWINQVNAVHLKELSTEERKVHIEDFERNLVVHIGEGRQPIDWLILLLARIYPIDEMFVMDFFDITEAEARERVAEAYSYVFIKTLPDKRISLHDEMRRMVNTYVWPVLDPTETLRQKHSLVISKYIKQQITKIEGQITQLRQQQVSGSSSLSLEYEDEKLKRALPILGEQLVFHAFYSDLVRDTNDSNRGIAEFVDQFDRRKYDYRFREALLSIFEEAIKKHPGHFSPKDMYEYQERKAKYLRDTGKYNDAYTIVQNVLNDRETLSAVQCIDMLIQRANLEIRRGSLETGIETFNEAITLSEQHELDEWRARALNGRGWAYRNQGDYTRALNDYQVAYSLSVVTNDDQRVASISNNMGYIYSILGNKQAAFHYCEDALDIRKRLGHTRDEAATHNTLGEIARRFGEYDLALEYYDRALEVFKSQEASEWICNVNAGRSLVMIARERYDTAHTLLLEALSLAPANIKPRILHHLAHTYWLTGNLVGARQYFEKCRQSSQEVGAHEFNFKSFADLLDILWEQGSSPVR